EAVGRGARRRQVQPGIPWREPREQLAGPPARMPLTRGDQERDDLRSDRVRMGMARPAAVGEPDRSLRLETSPPLVGRLAADPVLSTQRRDRQLPADTLDDEPGS